MEKRAVSFVPGLYKIFDEILVNAADNKRRDDSMKYIKVTINPELGEISVENDGNGIPVEVHETEGVYIPQMVFGELLTGDNYDDQKIVSLVGATATVPLQHFQPPSRLRRQIRPRKRYKQT